MCVQLSEQQFKLQNELNVDCMFSMSWAACACVRVCVSVCVHVWGTGSMKHVCSMHYDTQV
jgi:hypothetical protein